MNKTAVNICVQSSRERIFTSLREMPVSAVAGGSQRQFTGKCSSSPERLRHLALHHQRTSEPVSLRLCQHLVLSLFKILAILILVYRYLIMF